VDYDSDVYFCYLYAQKEYTEINKWDRKSIEIKNWKGKKE